MANPKPDISILCRHSDDRLRLVDEERYDGSNGSCLSLELTDSACLRRPNVTEPPEPDVEGPDGKLEVLGLEADI